MSVDLSTRSDAWEKGDYIEVAMSDNLMDRRQILVKFTPTLVGAFDESTNSWPKKCAHCWLDDYDHPPSPYFLGRRIDRPVEFDIADIGNFFVKDRVRQAIELVFPGQCTFHPTFAVRGKQQTAWFLGVPVATVNDSIPERNDDSPRCPVCGRPKFLRPKFFVHPSTLGTDFAKSAIVFQGETWEDRWDGVADINKFPRRPQTTHWTHMDYYRCCYISLRAELLFKKMGVKGLIRTSGWNNKPTKADQVWVAVQMTRLAERGLAERALESPIDLNRKWFDGYLKKNKRKKPVAVDFATIESKVGKPLPDSYKEFITKVGQKRFTDLEGTVGFDAEIVGPDQIDLTSYRRETLKIGDEEGAMVDGLMFATSGHGDVFCFDLAAPGPEYPVYLFEHDLNGFNVFAPNFVACLKQFVDKA